MSKPWETEPNRLQFVASGFDALICRHESLMHLCGYIALPKGHPDHGKQYDDVAGDVHGGWTYSRDRAPNEEPDGNWWVGFDCAHLGDLVPGTPDRYQEMFLDDALTDVYRDIEFVRAELEAAANQLLEAA